MKHFYCSCSRSKHDKQTTTSLSFFYCSQSTANNDQFRVNTQDLLSYNLIKHRDGHKEQNIGQPELNNESNGEL